jgi:hypothetical protein
MNQHIQIEELTQDHRAQRIGKQIWDGHDWRPLTYYRLPLARHARESAEQWLQDQFGASQARETWWIVGDNNLFMTQQVYTWWCLAHGVNERE